MNAMERFKAYEHKTFGDAAELYLAEFDGKCKDRQVYALRQALRFIEDTPLIDVDDSLENDVADGCIQMVVLSRQSIEC